MIHVDPGAGIDMEIFVKKNVVFLIENNDGMHFVCSNKDVFSHL
jgi:hypothetical protein